MCITAEKLPKFIKTIQLITVEARFSGHQFSGKPRFKGHSSENMGDRFLFLVYKSARNSGKSRFRGQNLGDRFFR